MKIKICGATIADINNVNDIIEFCKDNKCPVCWKDMIYDMQNSDNKYGIFDFIDELLDSMDKALSGD